MGNDFIISMCKNDLIMQNRLIGITSAHNARQLGGYHIGNKKIRKDVLIRTASLSSLSEEYSLLLNRSPKLDSCLIVYVDILSSDHHSSKSNILIVSRLVF